MTYTNEKCPVCNKAFTDDDDIVVCPVCGTPHHRECYEQLNKCANEASHSDSFEWKSEAEKTAEKPQPVKAYENNKVDDGHNIVFCPTCGKENPAEEPVCTNCGARLYNNAEKKIISTQVNLPDMSKQQFSTPVVQISPDDTIGGNKVSDTAEYIQLNAEKYIPKMFKMEKTKQKTSWNWAAFFFTPYWFFFRKMHVTGFIIMLVTLLVTGCCATNRLVTAVADYESAYEQFLDGGVTQEQAVAASEAVTKLPECKIMVGFDITVKVFSGLFANYFYKRKVEKEIRDIRLNSESPEDYRLKLFKKGGMSGTMCLLSFAGYFCALRLVLMLIIK